MSLFLGEIEENAICTFRYVWFFGTTPAPCFPTPTLGGINGVFILSDSDTEKGIDRK